MVQRATANNDGFSRYIEDIKEYARITPEREAELSAIIRAGENGTEEAVNELVQANLLLVVHCLKDFSHWAYSTDMGISELDLIAEGNIALMDAARSYDAAYDGGEDVAQQGHIKFSTYACKCIKRRMARALRASKFIRIPEAHFSSWRKLAEVESEAGDSLSNEEIAERIGVNVNKLGMIRHSLQCGTCMLEDIGRSDDGTSFWADVFSNDRAVKPDAETERHDLRRYLLERMARLKPRTREMLTLMYFSEKNPTLRDLSEIYHLSQERCRQICAAGLKALRDAIEPAWGKKVGIGLRFGSTPAAEAAMDRAIACVSRKRGSDAALAEVA